MSYRDELEAERSRVEALERQNAELKAQLEGARGPAPEKEPPKPPPAGSGVGRPFRVYAVVAVAVAFFATVLGTGTVSATLRLAAPFVCPQGYSRSVAVLHSYSTRPGSTSYSGTLWCAFPDKNHFPVRPNDSSLLAVLFLEWLVVSMSVASTVYLLRRQKDPET